MLTYPHKPSDTSFGSPALAETAESPMNSDAARRNLMMFGPSEGNGLSQRRGGRKRGERKERKIESGPSVMISLMRINQ